MDSADDWRSIGTITGRSVTIGATSMKSSCLKSIARTFCKAGAFALMLSAGTASANSFSFSFFNDPIFGNVNGTVTGHIDGLLDNATSAASAVYVDSFPGGLASFDVLGLPLLAGPINSFTVVNNTITDGSFFANTGAILLSLNFVPTNSASGANALYLDIGNYAVANNDGLNGVTFSAITAPVPEPEIYATLGIGLGLLGWVGRRKKLKAVAAA